MLGFLLAIISALPSPYIQFTQTDVPGSGLYCATDTPYYDLSGTLVVDAYLCIPDRVFSNGFEGVVVNKRDVIEPDRGN